MQAIRGKPYKTLLGHLDTPSKLHKNIYVSTQSKRIINAYKCAKNPFSLAVMQLINF